MASRNHAAVRGPGLMSALVLYGFPYDVTARHDTVPEPAQPPRAATTAAGAVEDFMTPDSTGAGVKEAYVRAATISNPVRVDWRREA